MKLLILCLAIGSVMAMAAGTQNLTYTNEEKGCMDDYNNHRQREGVDQCEVQKDLVECLLEHPDFDHFEPNDVARINEILDYIGRAPNCAIDIEQIGKDLEEGKDNLDIDIKMETDDPTERTIAYIDCADVFLDIDSAQKNKKCTAYRAYLDCILTVERNFGVAADFNVKQLQDAVDTEYFEGTECDLNVTTMLSAILAEDLKDDVTTTAPPPMDAPDDLTKDLMECTEELTNSFIIGSIQHTCPKVEKFIKCYFRALRDHDILREPKDYEGLEAELDGRLKKYNLQCDFNLHAIIRRLRDGETSPPDTTTMRNELEKKTQDLPNSEQDSIQECYEAFHEQTRRKDDKEEVCEPFRQYLECVFQVLKRNKHSLNDEEIQKLQDLVHKEMDICDMDVSSIYNSVFDSRPNLEPGSPGDAFCISDSLIKNVCIGLPDGDYAVCPPKCQTGAYIVCSNNKKVPSQCPNGYYGNNLHPMVFDPSEKSCQFSAAYCPRPEYDGLARK